MRGPALKQPLSNPLLAAVGKVIWCVRHRCSEKVPLCAERRCHISLRDQLLIVFEAFPFFVLSSSARWNALV